MPEAGVVVKTSSSNRTAQALAEAQAQVVARDGKLVAAPVALPVVSEEDQRSAAQAARKAAREASKAAGVKALQDQAKADAQK
jgi:hypothetical protein